MSRFSGNRRLGTWVMKDLSGFVSVSMIFRVDLVRVAYRGRSWKMPHCPRSSGPGIAKILRAFVGGLGRDPRCLRSPITCV